MKIVEDEGFCTACGTYGSVNIGEENFSLLKKDLANYKKYKDIYVGVCDNCGFVSTDITAEEGVLYGGIRNTSKYKEIYNYSYLNGLDKELYEFHSQDVPANLYEAYSLVAIQQKDYEKAIRLLNKAIELKLIMARKYRISKAELGGEEDNDHEYDELDKLIKKSVEHNRTQMDDFYKLVENKNVYLKLINIENLISLNKLDEAKKEYLTLTKKVQLENDLKTYFENNCI